MKGFYTQNEIENGASKKYEANNYSNRDTQSILEKYPEYGFKSTSVYNKCSLGRKWLMALYTFLLVFGGFLACSGIGSLIFYVILNVKHPDQPAGITSLILFGVFMLLAIPSLVIGWYNKGTRTSSFADYIQSKGRMRFFVKDGKFGLVNGFDFKILIPALYDKLSWNQKNEILRASLNGQSFLIDINNNRLK